MSTDAGMILLAFAFTLFAGLATGIGSAIAFFARRTNYRMLAVALAFSGGVMLYVSFREILGKAQTALQGSLGERAGSWAAVGAFFAGIALIAIIDALIPSVENPHEARTVRELEGLKPDRKADPAKLHRLGLFAAMAIGIHNFPEGLATFVATLHDPNVGLAIAVAIALHNIPEGVSVSVPIYYATGSRRRAFGLSVLSGLAEPAGALIGFVLLRHFLSEAVMGVLFGIVAGIMVFISIDELLPTAREYGEAHEVLYGLVAGMAVMAISLLLVL